MFITDQENHIENYSDGDSNNNDNNNNNCWIVQRLSELEIL